MEIEHAGNIRGRQEMLWSQPEYVVVLFDGKDATFRKRWDLAGMIKKKNPNTALGAVSEGLVN